MKTIGTKKIKDPVECLNEQNRLITELEQLRPYEKPKGIILKFKNWSDLETFSITRVAKKT